MMPKKERGLLTNAEYRPLEVNEFQDNQDGTESTEILIGVKIDGYETVIPSLWMTPSGPKKLRSSQAREQAIVYMKRTGKQFPQFNSVSEAEAFAQERTQLGGIRSGELAQ